MIRETTIRQYQQATIDIDKIRGVAGNPDLAESEVFDFPKFIIARSGRNHNRTDITPEGQRAAAPEWIGRPVYLKDHQTTATNQIGRIYDAWVEDDNGATVTYGRAFAVATQDDADLHAKIRNRIHKEMSCCYAVAESVCSICGANTLTAHCPQHEKHPDYCARDLAFKPDHVSFVGKPAVDGAGLVTHSVANTSTDETLRLSRLQEDGQVFREWVSAEFNKWYRLNNRNASAQDVEALTDKLSAREMLTFARIEQSRFQEIIPSGEQQLTTAPTEETEPVAPTYQSVKDIFINRSK